MLQGDSFLPYQGGSVSPPGNYGIVRLAKTLEIKCNTLITTKPRPPGPHPHIFQHFQGWRLHHGPGRKVEHQENQIDGHAAVLISGNPSCAFQALFEPAKALAWLCQVCLIQAHPTTAAIPLKHLYRDRHRKFQGFFSINTLHYSRFSSLNLIKEKCLKVMKHV